MTALPVAFRSNPGKYSFIGTTQLVNAYAEQQGSDGKGPMAVLPSEGLVEHADTESGPGRGIIAMEDTERVFSVHSSSIYELFEDGTVSRLGTVPGTEQVQMCRNQKADPQVLIIGESGAQVLETSSVSYITDSDLPSGSITCDYASGYGIFGYSDRTFYKSALNSFKSIASLDYATFEQRAGKLLRVKEHSGELVGFCSSWLEFWRDTGNADFPFEPIGWKPRGLKAANAVIASDNTLIFPGDDNNVYRLAGYDPQIISTHEVARLIQNDTAGEDITGFGFERDGHAFAVLTGTNWSRCYDSATKVWHSRKSYGYDRWRAVNSCKMWGKTLVQDRFSGKVFYLDKDTFTEDGGTMVWQVVSPPMHAFPNGGIIDALHLDLATGYGTLSGTGSDPKVMVEVSKDGGNVFDQYRELELGVAGNYAARVTTRRLGAFGPKGAVFRISISDPVVRALVNVAADVRPLR